jgi:hypothetical protein
MPDLETMARQHVASQEALIQKQLKLIQTLRQAGHSTDLAMDMLKTMERTLELYRRDLERITSKS